jgi:hypothetical protein
MDEIEAAFAIINLQSDNLGKPIYLVHGIDKGELANRVMIDEITNSNVSSTAYIFVFIYISLIFLYWV